MTEIKRISPQEASQKLEQGALLICAYEDRDKCNGIHIPGALSIQDLRPMLPDIPLYREIIFYCA